MTGDTKAPLLICCASLGAGAVALIDPGGSLQAAAGVLLILLLPGAALVALLGIRLAPADALLAAGACSIAIVTLAGVLLGFTRAGFAGASWTGITAGASIALSGIALARRTAAEPTAAGPAYPSLRPRVSGLSIALYAGAAALVALAIVLAQRSTSEQLRSRGIAQLWITPAGGGAGGAVGAARVGAGTLDKQRGVYHLELTAGRRATRNLEIALGPREALSPGIAMPSRGRARLRGGPGRSPVQLEVGSAAPSPSPPPPTGSAPHGRGSVRTATVRGGGRSR